MRAKYTNQFERGKDPKKSLKLGKENPEFIAKIREAINSKSFGPLSKAEIYLWENVDKLENKPIKIRVKKDFGTTSSTQLKPFSYSLWETFHEGEEHEARTIEVKKSDIWISMGIGSVTCGHSQFLKYLELI